MSFFNKKTLKKRGKNAKKREKTREKSHNCVIVTANAPSPILSAAAAGMPHISLRQKLPCGAYKYAAKLQKWRKRQRVQEADQAEEEAIFASLGIDDPCYEDQLDSDNSDSDSVSWFEDGTGQSGGRGPEPKD
ncbi:hypothetical protein DFH08DRAFT_813856 [Mycena albidolilacea]|uniref:Uncharacterized protein n=1 Tax=Mycena albidolilacea TaxID=1033008 RepID=A0AAD6ZRD7_9AGAR|nr:hypothetical protein DFH08DRAFT_813856 [Mycena albidolilacea]